MTEEVHRYHWERDAEDQAAVDRGRVRLARVNPTLVEIARDRDKGLVVVDDEDEPVAYIAPYDGHFVTISLDEEPSGAE